MSKAVKSEEEKRKRRCCIICDDSADFSREEMDSFLSQAIYQALKSKKRTFMIPYRGKYEQKAAYLIRRFTHYWKSYIIALIHPGLPVPPGSPELLKYANHRACLRLVIDHISPQDETNRWMVDHASLLILMTDPMNYDLLALATYATENNVPVIMNIKDSYHEPVLPEEVDLHDFMSEEEIAEVLSEEQGID